MRHIVVRAFWKGIHIDEDADGRRKAAKGHGIEGLTYCAQCD
jgi:hypothetical protein